MPKTAKRVPKSKLKWLAALSVPQLVYASKALGLVPEGHKRTKLVELITTHARVGRLRQCDVIEMRPTWDEVVAQIDWEPWNRDWSLCRRVEASFRAMTDAQRWELMEHLAEERRMEVPSVRDEEASAKALAWQKEPDPTRSKKRYAKSLGYVWAHPWSGSA